MISIAIDLGGTSIKFGILEDGELKYFKTLKAFPEKGLSHSLSILCSEISMAMDKVQIMLDRISGIGISFPGLVDSDRNKILSAPTEKYSDALNIDLTKWAMDNFSLPIVVENDANMALLGEWQYGAGIGYNDIVMVTLGTGIGTSVIIQGKPLRGIHYQAGCLGGHFTLDQNGGKCICGNTGCIETCVSTAMFSNIKYERSEYNRILSSEDKPDFKKIFEFASNGDQLAIDILERSIHIWGIALVNLIHAYDPEIIILSGGIMNNELRILPSLKEFVDTHAWTPWGKVKLVKANNPDTAALYGAHYKSNLTKGV